MIINKRRKKELQEERRRIEQKLCIYSSESVVNFIKLYDKEMAMAYICDPFWENPPKRGL